MPSPLACFCPTEVGTCHRCLPSCPTYGIDVLPPQYSSFLPPLQAGILPVCFGRQAKPVAGLAVQAADGMVGPTSQLTCSPDSGRRRGEEGWVGTRDVLELLLGDLVYLPMRKESRQACLPLAVKRPAGTWTNQCR